MKSKKRCVHGEFDAPSTAESPTTRGLEFIFEAFQQVNVESARSDVTKCFQQSRGCGAKKRRFKDGLTYTKLGES